MDCVQGALKSGFGPEISSKTTSFLDELVNGEVNGVDDLFVEELLDFSNDFTVTEEQTEGHEQDQRKACSVLTEEKSLTAPFENSGVSVEEGFGPIPETDFSFPAESLESLEWLSHFVEDSFSEYSLTGKLPPKPAPEVPVQDQEKPSFTTPVQTKARTKRARTGIRVWPASLTESSSNSSSSSTSSATSFSPPKKQKRKHADAGGCAAAQPRRCSHCGVTKTPQWRAGPLGSKTLCNACGVRFKSGRLLPEYRPACSPTFSTELHSNNHRKVLEMRRKKEVEPETAGLSDPVQSFV